MTSTDDVRLRTLHAVRILGYAGHARIAQRASIPPEEMETALLDAQTAGEVAWSQFGEDGGWSLTEAGKTMGESLLAEQLARASARPVVEWVMTEFEPLNARVAEACTRWQLTEMGIARRPTELTEVMADLSNSAEGWARLEERLVPYLSRFKGYHDRFGAAVQRAREDPAWVTALDRESAHRVWFELHEDLLATLGRTR